jgi:hypothetical protein
MQIQSVQEAVLYSREALRRDLQRVHCVWDHCQANSGRKHQTDLHFPSFAWRASVSLD